MKLPKKVSQDLKKKKGSPGKTPGGKSRLRILEAKFAREDVEETTHPGKKNDATGKAAKRKKKQAKQDEQ